MSRCNKIAPSARIARAVADVCLSPFSRMPVAIVDSIDYRTDFKVASQTAAAIGISLVSIEIPVGSIGDVKAVGERASRDLSLVSGEKIILILASDFEDCELHRDIIRGAAMMARESYSIDGETRLLVVSDAKEPIAHMLGECLERSDWSSFILL